MLFEKTIEIKERDLILIAETFKEISEESDVVWSDLLNLIGDTKVKEEDLDKIAIGNGSIKGKASFWASKVNE